MLTTPARIDRDSYLDLVMRFPLRRIKSDTQHAQAVKTFTRVSLAHQGTRDSGILDYLDILAGLIHQYEKSARLKAELLHRTPAEVMQHLIVAGGLTVSGLARQIGLGQSNLSEMLSGRRDFSKAAIEKLCRRFSLSSELFFPKSAA